MVPTKCDSLSTVEIIWCLRHSPHPAKAQSLEEDTNVQLYVDHEVHIPLEEVQVPWRDENRRPRDLQSSATSQRWGLLVTSCSTQTQVGPPPPTDSTRTEACLLFSRQQVTHVNLSWLCRSRSSPHPASLPSSFLPPSSPFTFPFFLLFFFFPFSLFVLSCFDAHIFSPSLSLSPTHPTNITHYKNHSGSSYWGGGIRGPHWASAYTVFSIGCSFHHSLLLGWKGFQGTSTEW